MILLDLHLRVKPLSANKMTGRNKSYKTKEYKQYQEDIRQELLGVDWPIGDNPCAFYVEAGLSNKLSDLDNVIKPLLDTFQCIYPEFNDKKVGYIELQKKTVKKGDDFLRVRVGTVSSGVIRKREELLEESPNLKAEKEQAEVSKSES